MSVTAYCDNVFRDDILTGCGCSDWLNSLSPGKFEWNFSHVIVKQILVIDGWGISREIAQIWMSLEFTDEQSTLVQLMACCLVQLMAWCLVHVIAWCRQATSHYPSQYLPRCLLPYGVTRPQRVKFIPRYMHTVHPFFLVAHLPISFRISSLALGRWCNPEECG